jgi:hypothetical protein
MAAINRAPFNALVDDDLSGLTGSAWDKAAIKNVILDPVDAALAATVPAVPTWITPPYSAADYWSSSGSWTVTAGNVIVNRYLKTGPLMVWVFQLAGVVITGTPLALYMRVPAGISFAIGGIFTPVALPAASYTFVVDGNTLGISLASGANWAAGTQYIYGTWLGPVNP